MALLPDASVLADPRPGSERAVSPERIRAGRRSVAVSNLDKVFYPEAGFSKGHVIDYYRAIAPVLMPHLKDRPMTLKRYPDGVEGKFFYEKRCPPSRPEWMRTVKIRRKRDDKDVAFCIFNETASLIWSANMGNLELHTSLARGRDIARPTAVVFDLDPGEGTGLGECARVALWLKDHLDDLGLDTFAKTSGSKGIQVYVPLNTKVTYDDTKPFAHAVARGLEDEHPGEVVSKMKKSLRAGKVYVDWAQNDDHKTTVSVYSLRARPRPTASTPVEWSEVEAGAGDPGALTFEAADVLERVDAHGDLFEPVRKKRQSLPKLS